MGTEQNTTPPLPEVFQTARTLWLENQYSPRDPRRGFYLRYSLPGKEGAWPELGVALIPRVDGWRVALGVILEINLPKYGQGDGGLDAEVDAALAVLRRTEARSEGLLSRMIQDHGRECHGGAGAIQRLVQLLREEQ